MTDSVQGGGDASQVTSKEMEGLLHEITALKESLRLERCKNLDVDSEFTFVVVWLVDLASCCAVVNTLCQKDQEVSLVSPVMNMKCKKVLKGHRGKILHCDWSPDKRHMMTAGQVCGYHSLHNTVYSSGVR